MAVYKVPQDVEAEDKLLGPLTLKQFIFAIITILLGWLAFTLGQSNLLLMLPFIPPILLFGYLAAPFQRDQPTDVYLGARLRFLFKPRVRTWDQSGMEELVRITVPKKVEVQLTNNLDQGEVRSRLEILASTIDTRGWATKNAYVNDPEAAMYHPDVNSDRLVGVEQFAQNVPETEITAADDILDPRNNRVALQMDQLAAQATQDIRSQAVQQMQQPTPQPYVPQYTRVAPTVIAPQQQQAPTFSQPAPQPTPEPEYTLPPQARYNPYPENIRQHVVSPMGQSKSSPAQQKNTKNETTESLPQSAKLEGLAQRDDLSVDVLAREADRVVHGDGDEVVINLH